MVELGSPATGEVPHLLVASWHQHLLVASWHQQSVRSHTELAEGFARQRGCGKCLALQSEKGLQLLWAPPPHPPEEQLLLLVGGGVPDPTAELSGFPRPCSLLQALLCRQKRWELPLPASEVIPNSSGHGCA